MIQPRSFDRGFFYRALIYHAFGLISLAQVFLLVKRYIPAERIPIIIARMYIIDEALY